MIIILTLSESGNQIIYGIPEYIELTTNTPSTIFYTLDGSTPTSDSDIFVDRLYLPTNVFSVTVKAVAISGDDSSAELEEEYLVSQVKLNRGRLTDNEGINVLPPDSDVIDSLSFDEDGNAAQESSISFTDLDLKASTTDRIGQEIPVSTTIDFINFARPKALSFRAEISRPEDVNFNPGANYIIVDGFTEDSLRSQLVKIINRPNGTLELKNRKYQKQGEYNLASSSLVRTMMNPRTGKVVFYYRDSRENRWLTSTQYSNIPTLNLSPTEGPPSSFVFRWVEHRYGSKIF